MSHLRNLFHKPSGQEHIPAAVPFVAPPFAAVPEHVTTSAKTASATSVLPEFPVEEAQLRPGNRLVYYADPAARRPTASACSG